MELLTPEDLAPFAVIDPARAEAMIEDVTATALRVAPCLATASDQTKRAAKAILRRAVLRWHESGIAGTVTQESAGPFQRTITTRTSAGLLWPSEINELQSLCRGASAGAFTIKPNYATGNHHADDCSTTWGRECSCGSNLNHGRGPIFGSQP